MSDDLANWTLAVRILRLRAVMHLDRVGGEIAWPGAEEAFSLVDLMIAGRAG